MGFEMSKRRTTIQISKETYDELFKMKLALMGAYGKACSFDDVIRELLKRSKEKR